MLRLIWVMLALGLLAIPTSVAAQQIEFDGGGFVLRADGDVTIVEDDVVETVLVINGDVFIAGKVESVIVIDGTATLAGARVKNLTVISGKADLQAGTIVTNDVRLIDSDLTRASGVVIEGSIEDDPGFGFWLSLWIALIVFYIGVTIALIIAALIAVALAGRQIRAVGVIMTQEPGKTALGALALLVGGPIVGILAFITIVGIPVAMGVFMALVALSVVGYIVAGVWLGDQIVGGLRGQAEAGRPYLSAVVGLLALQATAFLPVIGTLVWLLAQIGGVGAIGVMTWRTARGPGAAAEATTATPAS